MGAVSIDELQIRINGSSTNAYAAVDALIGALEKLQSIRIDGGIASAIDGIGKAASKATSKVSKMSAEFAKGASSMSKYAMTLKNFQWDFGNNSTGLANARQPFAQYDAGYTSMFDSVPRIGRDDIIDASFYEVQPLLLTMAQDSVTSFNTVGASLELLKAKMSRLAGNIQSGIAPAIDHFKKKMEEASKSAGRFFKSIQRIATYRLIRSALKAITSGLREGIQNLAQYSKAIGETDTWAANSVMSDYATKFLEVKNAVGSAAMPVLVALQPVIIGIANAFIYATNALNMFFSALGGSGTYTKAQTAAVDYAATLDKSSKGASKAAKELSAGFDELNVLSDSSGGGGGASSNGMPDFKDMFSENMIPQWLIDNLQLIKDLVIAIGVGLLAWKIASLFTDDLGKIAGIAIAAAGAFLLLKGAIEGWTQGVNWSNFVEMLGGALLLTLGLGLAFGTLGAGIGLVIGGIVMLVVGLKDWITTGELSQETFFLLEAGILAVAAGFALLVPAVGWIALVVGAVIALALAIYYYWDEIVVFFETCLNNIRDNWQIFKDAMIELWENIKKNLQDKWNAVATFFRELWDGIKKNLEDKWKAIELFFNVTVPRIINNVVKFFAELPSKIKAKIDEVKTTIANWVTDAIGWVTTEVPKLINSIIDWFGKIPESLVNVGKNMIKALWNGILSMGTWLWDKITGFLGALGEFAGEILGNLGGGTEEALDALPRYASGGVVGSGQMFLARENGMPELVGNIGGNTAVMNNDQIVSAVSSGVYDAVVSAMSQTSGHQQSVQVFLNGKQIESATRDTKQRRGATIANGGVYNFA